MSKPKIFISHIHEDAPLAHLLAKYIEQTFAKALEVFVSSDGTNILLRDKWMQQIEKALEESSLAIILASPNAVARPWINFEAGAAWMKGARVIPACVKGMAVSALPQPLSSLQACDISTMAGIGLFFDNIGKIYDLDSRFTDLAKIHADLAEVVALPVESSSRVTAKMSAEEGRAFAGRWVTQELTNPFDKNDKFRLHFDLEVKADTALGTVREISTESGGYVTEKGILDGKIKDGVISFYTPEQSFSGVGEITTYKNLYYGSVSNGEIEFILQSDRPWGFPAQKFMAK